MPILIALLAALLSGCVNSAKVHSDFTGEWIGKPLDEFTMRFGLAKGAQKLASGKTVVEWESVYGVPHNGSALMAVVAAAGDAETQAGPLQLRCQLRLLVTTSGAIEQITIVKDTAGRFASAGRLI